MCEGFACMCMYHIHACCPRRSGERIDLPGGGAKDGSEPPYGCWQPSPFPWPKQLVLLTQGQLSTLVCIFLSINKSQILYNVCVCVHHELLYAWGSYGPDTHISLAILPYSNTEGLASLMLWHSSPCGEFQI